MKILDPIRILETIEKLGARKSIKYAFIGTGCILVVVVPICYAITSVKSRGKSKEQNNASANKQGEIKCTSECKIRGKDQTHAHRMEENAQVHEHHMEEIEAKKKADIEKMEKRDELRKDRDAEKANQPLVGLHLFMSARKGVLDSPGCGRGMIPVLPVRPTVENQFSLCRLLRLWREVVVM